jgi:hypothetical protein
LPALVSDFNLLIGKPGVIFYEGEEGLKKVLYDSLKTKSIIYQYIDNENIVKTFREIDDAYTKKRNILGIKKRMLIVDCEYVRKHADDYNRETSDVRIINKSNISLKSTLMIYDNKISYVTINKKIGILIEDADIAETHRVLFEYAWEKSEPLFKDE